MGNANTDWQKQIYYTALGQNNELSVSGALKNMPYRISAGFLNQDGILKTDNLKRTSLSINLNPQLFDNHLNIQFSVLGTYSQSRFANQGAIGVAVNFDPTQPVYSGSNRFGGYWEWLDPTSISGFKGLAPRNPMGLLMLRDDKSTVQRSIGSAQFDYKVHFLPDLHAKLSLSYDISQGEGTIYVPDSAASSYKRFVDANGVYHSGVNDQYKQTNANTFLQFYLNYIKDLKKIRSRIDVMGGYEFNDYLTTNYYYADLSANGVKAPNSDPIYPFDKPENTIISFFGR
jgi:iron complex outermembrane receptor protein